MRKYAGKDNEDIYLSPEKMGYKDRKMAKWQGFIVGELSGAHVQNDKRNSENTPKIRMSDQDVREKLSESFSYKKEVMIQLDERQLIESDKSWREETGVVTAIQGSSFYLQTAVECLKLEWTEVRYVQVSKGLKWFTQD